LDDFEIKNITSTLPTRPYGQNGLVFVVFKLTCFTVNQQGDAWLESVATR